MMGTQHAKTYTSTYTLNAFFKDYNSVAYENFTPNYLGKNPCHCYD